MTLLGKSPELLGETASSFVAAQFIAHTWPLIGPERYDETGAINCAATKGCGAIKDVHVSRWMLVFPNRIIDCTSQMKVDGVLGSWHVAVVPSGTTVRVSSMI